MERKSVHVAPMPGKGCIRCVKSARRNNLYLKRVGRLLQETGQPAHNAALSFREPGSTINESPFDPGD
jgi:hypothetical protein